MALSDTHQAPVPIFGNSYELMRGGIREMQRRRMLIASADAVAEVGRSGLTVAEIIRRAKVSRKTFYEIFTGCEDCFLCTFNQAVAEVSLLAQDAYFREHGWRDRVRGALTRLLIHFEEEPARARLILIESCAAGKTVLVRRAEIMRELAGVIDGGRHLKGGAFTFTSSMLTAEALVGGAVSIVQSRIQQQPAARLTDLSAQLMSMIVLPYQGAAVARRELRRSGPGAAVLAPSRERQRQSNPIAGLNMRLTYRTVQVLRSIRESPGASNRAIAEVSGISDQGQISKLAARLERLGLLENHGEGPVKGGTNAWYLTTRGAELERACRAY